MTQPPAPPATPGGLPATFDGLPPVRRVPDAEARIRRHNQRTGRRLAVLDDDPTGSQAVHGVSVVTVLECAEYLRGLAEPGDTCFILTNSRSLREPEAAGVNRTVARDLYAWAAASGGTVEIVSRGDSTLRGHVIAEIEAIAAQRLAVTGTPADGVLFCPAMLDAGRYTVGDTHFAVVGGVPTPVSRTEYARDQAFGYTRANLREFLAERSGGAIAAEDVASLSLEDIRVGGPERVGQVLSTISDGRWVVVNAADDADLTVVALGLQLTQDAGRAFLVRSGPSFVRALAGIAAKPPLGSADIAIDPARSRHGLVVVGSHVELTTRQMDVLRDSGDLATVELHVPTLLDADRAAAHVADVVRRMISALDRADVLLYTSRDLVPGRDRASSLEVARTVSTALVSAVRRIRAALPAWIIAKGGITGHDVAARALGMRRAIVSGQFLPGQISLLQPVDAPGDVLTCRYVVFPGNVGADGTLAEVRDRLVAATAAARPR